MTDKEQNYLLIGAGVIVLFLFFTRKSASAEELQPGIYVQDQSKIPPGIIRIDIDIEKTSKDVWVKLQDLLGI